MNRHRRGLCRNIRLPTAERHADIGKGECGRVVDAVADHHHRPALFQLVHIARLILGQDLRMIGVHIHIARHLGRDCLSVARQHDDLVHAAAAQLVQRLLHLRTDGILDPDHADEARITRNKEHIFAGGGRSEILRIRHAVLLQETAAADADRSARKALEIRHLGEHPARYDRLGGAVLRRMPCLFLHILLDRHGERMHGVLLGGCREQDHLLLRHARRRADERDLGDADRQRARLVEHDRIRARKRLDVVAALHENPALGRRGNRGRHRRRRRELQPAGEVDEEQVQHTSPVARCPVDNRRPEEGHGHEIVRHLIGKILHGCAARLRLLDEVDDVGERRIAAHLLHRDHELARLDHAARVDRRALLLHRGGGLTRHGRLRHSRIAAQNAAVDDDFLPCVYGDRITGAHLLHGYLALHLAIRRLLHEPDIALAE